MSKIVVAVLAIVMLAGLVSGCGASQQNKTLPASGNPQMPVYQREQNGKTFTFFDPNVPPTGATKEYDPSFPDQTLVEKIKFGEKASYKFQGWLPKDLAGPCVLDRDGSLVVDIFDNEVNALGENDPNKLTLPFYRTAKGKVYSDTKIDPKTNTPIRVPGSQPGDNPVVRDYDDSYFSDKLPLNLSKYITLEEIKTGNIVLALSYYGDASNVEVAYYYINEYNYKAWNDTDILPGTELEYFVYNFTYGFFYMPKEVEDKQYEGTRWLGVDKMKRKMLQSGTFKVPPKR